jgi:FMN phosphatase YigB (HAD superfamily)
MQRGISFDKNVIRKKLMMYFADTKRFLFLDTEGLLSTLRENGHILYILSFGDRDFQTAKIFGTSVGSFLEKVIVTDTDKAEAMRSEIDVHDEVWFLDDKIHFIESVKKAFPNVRTILVQRKEDQHCKEKSSEFCDYVVRDLRKALEIIKDLE